MLLAVVQERSRYLAAIIATLAIWIVFSASSRNQRQTADFEGAMVVGSVASLGFVVARWVSLRREWGFLITLIGTPRSARAASRSSSRKATELEALAVGRWGPAAQARHLWVVRATARNRDLLARYPEVFAARFQGSSLTELNGSVI